MSLQVTESTISIQFGYALLAEWVPFVIWHFYKPDLTKCTVGPVSLSGQPLTELCIGKFPVDHVFPLHSDFHVEVSPVSSLLTQNQKQLAVYVAGAFYFSCIFYDLLFLSHVLFFWPWDGMIWAHGLHCTSISYRWTYLQYDIPLFLAQKSLYLCRFYESKALWSSVAGRDLNLQTIHAFTHTK